MGPLRIVRFKRPDFSPCALHISAAIHIGIALFEREIDRKSRITHGQIFQTLAINLGESAFVRHTKQFAHMDCRHIFLRRKLPAVREFYPLHRMVLHDNACDLSAIQHFTACLFDHLAQRIGELSTIPHKSRRSFDIEHIDHCVDIGWSVSSASTVHRIHVRQQLTEVFVFYVLCDKFIGWHEAIFAECCHRVGGTKMKERELVGDAVEGVDISCDASFFLWEIACPTLGESFTTTADFIAIACGCHEDFVHCFIHILQTKLVVDAEIITESS